MLSNLFKGTLQPKPREDVRHCLWSESHLSPLTIVAVLAGVSYLSHQLQLCWDNWRGPIGSIRTQETRLGGCQSHSRVSLGKTKPQGLCPEGLIMLLSFSLIVAFVVTTSLIIYWLYESSHGGS